MADAAADAPRVEGSDFLAALQAARTAGVITPEQYAAKLAEHHGRCGNTVVPTKLMHAGGGMKSVLDFQALGWKAVLGPFDTAAAADAAMQAMADEDNAGRWSFVRVQRHVKTLCCNAHIDCQVHVRRTQIDGSYYVQRLAGIDHTLQPKLKQRTNSRLTFEQEAEFKTGIDHGSKPAALLAKSSLAAIAGGSSARVGSAVGVEGASPSDYRVMIVYLYRIRLVSSLYCVAYRLTY